MIITMNKILVTIKNCLVIQVITIIVFNFFLSKILPNDDNIFKVLLGYFRGIPLGFYYMFNSELKFILWPLLLLTIFITIFFIKKQNNTLTFLFYFFYTFVWACPGYYLILFLVFFIQSDSSRIY